MSHKPLEQTDLSAHYCDEPILAHDVPFRDYLAQYGEQRTDWLMGLIIDLMSNNDTHQTLMTFLTKLLGLFLDFHFGVGARLFTATYPMYISDKQPARQPDLLVVLEAHVERIQPTYLNGPADFVLEIVSPESSTRDKVVKVREYAAAGVPEYWIIDPQQSLLLAYALDEQTGAYQPIPMLAGVVRSHLLPGFALDAAILWQRPLPYGSGLIEMAQRMAAEVSES